MRKTILIFSLLIFGCYYSLQAQDTGWETGVNLSGGTSAHLNKTNNATKTSLYYSTGVYGRKFFKQKYGVEVGVQYTSFSLGFKTPITDVNGNMINVGRGSFRHNYVEVPIRFVFKHDFKIVSVGCYAGIAPAFITHAYSRLHYRDEQNAKQEIQFNETNNLPKFNLIADAGLLIRFTISSCLAIDAKPFFRAQMLSLNTNSTNPSSKVHPYAAGITVTTVWKF